MLVLDGHVSHTSLEVVDLARANDVCLMLMPPHSSHILQPLDVGVFGPAKKVWFEVYQDFGDRHLGMKTLSKEQFPSLLRQVWEDQRAFTGAHLRGGFRECGLFPIAPSRVTSDKLSTSLINVTSAAPSAPQPAIQATPEKRETPTPQTATPGTKMRAALAESVLEVLQLKAQEAELRRPQ